MTERVELKPCKCGEIPKLHGADDMGYLIVHSCIHGRWRITDNELMPCVAAWNRRDEG